MPTYINPSNYNPTDAQMPVVPGAKRKPIFLDRINNIGRTMGFGVNELFGTNFGAPKKPKAQMPVYTGMAGEQVIPGVSAPRYFGIPDPTPTVSNTQLRFGS